MAILNNTGIRAGASGAGAGGGDYNVEKSLRFNDDDSAYLTWTPSADGNKKTWTWSAWIKFADINSKGYLLTGADSGTYYAMITFFGNDTGTPGRAYKICFQNYAGSSFGTNFYDVYTEQVFRDPSAWYHIVCTVDTTQSTPANRVKFYVNGVEESKTDSAGTGAATYGDQDISTQLPLDGDPIRIGDVNGYTDGYFDGYMADVHFIDGTALDPSSFGETHEDTGQWVPKEHSESHGTNGFHLKFDGTDLGEDSAGSNNFTANNLTPAGTNIDVPCVKFDGDDDYLSIADHADLGFGSGDFTVEAFINPETPASNRNQTVAGSFQSGHGSYSVSSWQLALYSKTDGTSQLLFYFCHGENGNFANTGYILNHGKWYHVVGTRDGDNLRIYVDGVHQASIDVSSYAAMNDSSAAVTIGNDVDANWDMEGAISNLRVVKGTCLYPSGTTFTVPSKPLANVTNTKLLCCQSSSTTADDNSDNDHTITASGGAAAGTKSDDPLDDDVSDDTPGSPWDNGRNGGGNYATLNPLHTGASTLSNGNLDASGTGDLPTIIPGSGQWYYEIDGTGYDWDGTVDNFTSAAGSYNFGQRPFEGTVTTDYKALNTFNLDAPLIDDPSEYFDVRSGLSAPFTVSDINFEADLIVGKSTSNSEYWIWADAVRGFDKPLKSNTTTAEGSGDAYTSVGSSGYSSDNNWFSSGRTYTTWAWDAGSEDAETNDDGSIDSEVKANPTAGFSIVKYTSASGTGSISATIGHGLNADIGFMIIKNRDWASSSQGWPVWHQSSPTATRYLDATGDFSNSEYTSFFNANPTDSVFSVRCNGSVSTGNRYRSYGNSYNYIAYLWSEVEGYSKFGSWDGNNSPDGTFVYTNFRPAFLLWKRSNGTTNWYIYDSSRSTVNVVNDNLETNTADPENTLTSMNVDFTSNGFKMRGSDGDINGSGGTYVYAAFAETPFKYSNAR